MELPDQLLTLYSAAIEEQDGRYVVEVPERELDIGKVHEHASYRVALIGQPETPNDDQAESNDSPPVEEGDERVVDIESLGEQGDGIAKIDAGYVLIVEDVEVGDRVRVTVQNAQQNVAFTEVEEFVESQETYL